MSNFWSYARKQICDYFRDCNDKATLRKRYLQLAKEHHPDHGGCLETMKDINNQYEALEARFKREEERQKPPTPDDSNERSGEYQQPYFNPKDFEEILSKLMSMSAEILDGLTFEMVGTWLWVHGDTKVAKEFLKVYGFRWAPKKKAWYWYPEGHEPKGRVFKGGMDKLRELHGSELLKTCTGRKSALRA